MGTFFKGLLIVISLCALSSAGIRYEITYKNDVPRMSEREIEQMVSNTLNLEKSTVPYYLGTVKVYTKAGGDEDYLVVTLFRSDCYLAIVYRLDYSGSEVVAIIRDYIEESNDEELCGTCPDPDVEVLISYVEDALFPGAIEHGWGTNNMLIGEGLKSELLIGHWETKQTVLNWLACPKLKAWGRIGHGNKNGITFNDYQGSLTANDVANLADDIKGKTFIFNSCLCHNDPFEPAMIDAGAYFYAGGDISLSGGKEGVFSSFFNKAVKQNMELTKAMDQAISENNYPNAWGYSGAGEPPYYLEFGVTAVSNTAPMTRDDFSILVTTNRVLFKSDAGNHVSMISIFNPVGKLIYYDMLSQAASSWNLTTANGQKVTSGNYIAVLKSQAGTNSIKKAFTIVK